MTSLRGLWVVFALAVAGCGTKTEEAPARPYPLPEVSQEGKLVAKIGDVKLTTAELEKRINQQSPFLRAQLKDPEQRKKFIDNEIRVELLAQEGWRRKMYDDPRIIAELKRAIVQKMMRDEMNSLAPKIDISDGELHDAYTRKESEYSKPEKVRLSQIVIKASSPAEKAAAKKKLEGVRAEIEKDKVKGPQVAFAEAARKYSEDEGTKRGGGDLQFFVKEDAAAKLNPAAAEEIFSDKLEMAGMMVTDTPDGVALIQKTGRRRAVVRTLEMVKPQLRSQLLAEKRTQLFEQYVKELMKTTSVDVDEDAMKDVKVDMNAPAQPQPQDEHEEEEE